MESHEALRAAVEPVGAKKVAQDVKVSTSLVYKWCGDESGARNPLDRLEALLESTQDNGPLEWLCRRRGGVFMRDPAVDLADFDSEYLLHTQRMLQKFSELLKVVSDSMINDGHVDPKESERIRREWDRLKADSERFVVACETGLFDDQDGVKPRKR